MRGILPLLALVGVGVKASRRDQVYESSPWVCCYDDVGTLMGDLFPFIFVVIVCQVAAWTATGSRVQRVLGVGIAFLSFGAPWLLPPSHTVVRGILGVFLLIGVLRVADLRQGRWTLRGRISHVLSVVDTRTLRRASARFDARGFARVVAWEVLAALVYLWLTQWMPEVSGAIHWAMRWAGGLVFVYAFSEGAYALLSAGYSAVGFRTPILHRHPAASRSVEEFWAKRWNRIVSSWLAATLFRPLAREGHPVRGLCLAFAFSALVHAYIAYEVEGAYMASIMLGFFLLQAVLVILERLLLVTRWPAVPAHIWTVFWMVGASPMFTEPLLRTIGA